MFSVLNLLECSLYDGSDHHLIVSHFYSRDVCVDPKDPPPHHPPLDVRLHYSVCIYSIINNYMYVLM